MRLETVFKAVFLVLFGAGVLSGAFAGKRWAELYAASFFLAGAVLYALEQIYWFRAYKRQAAEEHAFANSEQLPEKYTPSYVWSESNSAVIRKFQTVADRREIMELSIEASRFIALQQQINPHFLYNTLDSIRSDMLLSGNVGIADTVESLSKYFSYVVTNLDQLATISEELGNVKDYFHIQKYRFGDRINLEIINELGAQEIKDQCIPRLTLQPLVENAVSHGLESSGSAGTVTIHLMKTSENLIIHVIDDGSGMSTESLKRLNERLNDPLNWKREKQKRGGIALDNVNSRIKLLFGETYGLRAFSIEGAGTDISMLLPDILKDSGDEERTFKDYGCQ